jgi:hypothetical protein
MFDNITFTDWGELLFSGLTFILACYLAYLGNKINRQSIKLDQSNLEIYANEMIGALNKELREGNNLSGDILDSWVRDYLNVFELICLSYLNGDIDEDRFIRSRKLEIQQLVESGNLAPREKLGIILSIFVE